MAGVEFTEKQETELPHGSFGQMYDALKLLGSVDGMLIPHVSPSSPYITGLSRTSIEVFDLKEKNRFHFPSQVPARFLPHLNTSIVYSPDGKLIAVWGQSGTTEIYDLEKRTALDIPIGVNEVGPRARKKLEKSIKDPEVLERALRSNQGVIRAEFSATGRHLLVVYKNFRLRVFDVEEKKVLPTPYINAYQREVGFSPDGTAVVEGSKKLYDLGVKKSEPKEQHEEQIEERPDIRHRYDKSTRTIQIIDNNTGKVIAKAERDETIDLAAGGKISLIFPPRIFSPMGAWPRGIRFIDLETGEEITGLIGAPRKILLSPDENKVIAIHDSSYQNGPAKFAVFDLQKKQGIPLPYYGLTGGFYPAFTYDSKQILIRDGNHSRLVDIEAFADAPLAELVKTMGGFAAEGLQILTNLMQRAVIETPAELEKWFGFLTGKIGLPTEEIEKASRLTRIELCDGGNAITSVSALAELAIATAGDLDFDELPVSGMPWFRNIKTSELPTLTGKEFRRLLGEASEFKVLGRTMVFRLEDNGHFLALKFLRGNEDPGRLVYESRMLAFLQRLKQSGVPLKSDYPTPVLVKDGESAARIKATDMSENVRSEAGRVSVLDRANRYAFFAYEASGYDYFRYLHELPEPEESSGRSIHDLFTLARFGIIHPDVIDLFHNRIQSGRPDLGKYIWNIDIIRPMAARFGAGRLHAWEEATAYPNLAASGIRDFAEVLHLGWLDLNDFSEPHIRPLRESLDRFSTEDRRKFALQYFLGNYLLGWVLAEGKHLKNQDQLDTGNEQQIAEAAKRIFVTAYSAFTGNPDSSSHLVDWGCFARQMIFFMGGEYKDVMDDAIPEDIYGLKDVKIIPGDGWGFSEYNSGWRFDGIHEDLGPVNGPLPLQEFIKANYLYTAVMIRDFLKSKQGKQ